MKNRLAIPIDHALEADAERDAAESAGAEVPEDVVAMCRDAARDARAEYERHVQTAAMGLVGHDWIEQALARRIPPQMGGRPAGYISDAPAVRLAQLREENATLAGLLTHALNRVEVLEAENAALLGEPVEHDSDWLFAEDAHMTVLPQRARELERSGRRAACRWLRAADGAIIGVRLGSIPRAAGAVERSVA